MLKSEPTLRAHARIYFLRVGREGESTRAWPDEVIFPS
jgi:hypothetical protein